MNQEPDSNQPSNQPPQPESSASPDQEPATQPQTNNPESTTQTTQQQSDFAAQAERAEPVQSPYAQSVSQQPKRSRKAGLLIGLVAGLLLLGGAGAAAYVWHQDPERAVNNAIAHFASQKHVQTQTVITSDDSLATGLFNVKLNRLTIDASVADAPVSSAAATIELSFNGNDYKLSGEGRIVDGDNIYFRINDVMDTYDKAMRDFGAPEDRASADVRRQIENMQNKWVKVTPDDMGEDKEAFVCSMNAIRTHAQSDESMNFARDAYDQHAFIVPKEKVGSRDGLTGYKVEIDNAKLKEYMKSAEESPLVKVLEACAPSDDETARPSEDQLKSASEDTNADVTMWVTQFSHQLQELEYTVTTKNTINNDANYTMTGVTKFDYTKPTIEAPADSTELQEWLESLESTTGDMFGADATMQTEPMTFEQN